MLNEIRSSEMPLLANYEDGGLGISLRDEKPCMEVYINGTYRWPMSTETLETNQIYNIVGTYDGNNVKIYVNSE